MYETVVHRFVGPVPGACTGCIRQTANPLAFDGSCAADIGLTYTEIVQKYGEMTGHEFYRGGAFLYFQNCAHKLHFENSGTGGQLGCTDPGKSDDLIIDENGKCVNIIATVGDVFKTDSATISIADIETLLGCQVTTQDDMAYGDHQILFSHEGRQYIIEIFPAADTFTPADRIRIN